MKKINRLLVPSLLAFTLCGMLSCGVDRWSEYAAETAFDEWMTQTLRENYLWYTEVPADKSLNFFTRPDAFLKTIVSKEDQISFIDTLRKEPLPSYGFSYTLYRVADNDTAYNALITNVLPDSPAEAAGLKRGEWMMQVNHKVITKQNEPLLLESGKALLLQLGMYTTQKDPETDASIGIVIKSRTADLEARRVVEENPVNDYRVITASNGLKVGYLVYNRFIAGTAAEPQKYNDRLRTISREMATAGVTRFILDLRNNTGGSLECAQLLCSLLAPAEALGTPLGSLVYNDKQTEKNRDLLFDPKLIGTGVNLNIELGMIITSGTTSGISGSLYAWLAPLNKWGLVGAPLTCHGVATETFINPEKTWAFNPVVCTVLNSQKESYRGKSFKPHKSVNEQSDLHTFLPYGDEKEALLSVALGLIDGRLTPDTKTNN
ncbi:MAG: S41 family peptidase [Bacteroides sp.]